LQGYDVSDELENVRAFNQIIPMTESQIELKNVPDNCRKALDKYNEMEVSLFFSLEEFTDLLQQKNEKSQSHH
jgi:hypothetical protein